MGAVGTIEPDRIEVGEMRRSECEEAIAVIARAMSDSPQHVAAFGSDHERIRRNLARMFGSMFATVRGQVPLVARLDGRIVGATNDLREAGCRPTAIEGPTLQGRGIGSLVLAEYTRRLDADGVDAYLETDKPENVALYSRFGFEVVDEGAVLGVPNWFMWRTAGADAPNTPAAVSLANMG